VYVYITSNDRNFHESCVGRQLTAARNNSRASASPMGGKCAIMAVLSPIETKSKEKREHI
jgi:hypothetical protein